MKVELVLRYDLEDTSEETLVVARKAEEYARLVQAILGEAEKTGTLTPTKILFLMEEHNAGDFAST